MRKASEYALYYGERFIDIGTIKELAEKTHKAEITLRHYSTPAHYRRTNGNSYVCILIGD